MDNMIVTRMEENMIDECVDLFISTFSREPWNDVYESRDQVRQFFVNHFANNYFLGYVVSINGKIEGLSVGIKKPWINGLEYYIDEFCINYSCQGKGIGSKFINEIEKDINSQGLNGMMLNTEKGYPSFEFYKKNGFEELGDLIVMGK
ncbi:GNAT family N-acetyltransferase [Inconstantimicrobium mannanitabidum]|uniref:N-acetyltransferase n=1 Tax=Inconstantimicrobium mannanitabidum TaxID=1604901 RepID=A0ACB5R9G4_9CLOT|nr:GNAT family N-acetyltransferase [Clostridium sp. TW13]GKX65675.1 N-acetyltransferase [Clostridium sp. TW13]